MASALVLGEGELRPLINIPSRMDAAIDAISDATVAFYRGKVRERDLTDKTVGSGQPNLLQIHFAANDEVVSGFQVFAESSGARGVGNNRFITLLDRETRHLLAIVDYTTLNPFRVGASAGVGCRYLAPEGARVVGILGSSKQARAQLQAIQRTVPTLERARVFSPTPEHRETFAREMTEWLDLPVDAVDTAQKATDGADIIGLANNSREPVIDLGWLKPGSLVISISSGQLSADVMQDRRIVATTWDSLATREPYESAIKAGAFSKESIAAELGALITGEASVPRDASRVTIFELTRLNVWAIAVALWAYRSALETGAGIPFTLSGG